MTKVATTLAILIVTLLVPRDDQARQRDSIAAGSTALVFEDVTAVQGADGPRLEHATIVVRDGRFTFVGSSASSAQPPDAAERVQGGFLIPGLIDQHAHVTVRPMTSPGVVADHADPEATRQVLELLLRFGITTVRNPEAPLPDGVELRERLKKGELRGPDVVTAGPAMSAGYSPESVRREVRRQAAAGVDWVKVGGAMPPDVLRAAVEEAHAVGVRAVGHLQRTTWTAAARAGIDAITHAAPWSPEYLAPSLRKKYAQTMKGRLDWLEWVDLDGAALRETIRELRDRGIWLDPTLIAYDTKFRGDDPRYLESPDLPFAPRTVLKDWSRWTFTAGWTAADYRRGHRLWPRVLALTRACWSAGVRLTTGSDFPNPWVVPGASLHTELELLVSAGIPPLEVLSMATSRGARALGLEAEIGSIAAGKRANAVWLRHDPANDIRNTRSIRGVIKDGRWVHRAD